MSEMECASTSLVNVRVVRFLQHRNVLVLVWPSGLDFTTPKCASASLVNVRVVQS